MSTLKAFSDKDRAYHAYQARQNYLREQRGIQRHLDELKTETEQQRAALEQARAEKEQAQAEKEQAQTRAEQERAAKEAALAEIARLKAQLQDQTRTH